MTTWSQSCRRRKWRRDIAILILLALASQISFLFWWYQAHSGEERGETSRASNPYMPSVDSRQHAFVYANSTPLDNASYVVEGNNDALLSSAPPPPSSRPYSRVHCVGDTFLPDAWVYRSCQYQNLCWDPKFNDWVLLPSPVQLELERKWNQRFSSSHVDTDHKGQPYARSSSSVNETRLVLSTIGMTSLWRRRQKYAWHPKVLLDAGRDDNPMQLMGDDQSFTTKIPPTPYNHSEASCDYHFMPRDIVLIPVSVADTTSTMSLLMDTLFGIFNLIRMFGFHNKKVLLHILNNNKNGNNSNTRHGSDYDCTGECWKLWELGIKWMGYDMWTPPPQTATSTTSFSSPQGDTLTSPPLLCAPNAASGLGMLTATGLSSRGRQAKDYRRSINVGRGGDFWEFRNHILNATMATTSTRSGIDDALRVYIASPTNSSSFWTALMEALVKARSGDLVVTLGNGNKERNQLLQVACQTDIWIAPANDDSYTWPALFLPRDATLMLLYDETCSIKGRLRDIGEPIRPDFDVWNNMSHLKVHWLSLQHEIGFLVQYILDLIPREEVGMAVQSQNQFSTEPFDVGNFNGNRVRLVQNSSLHSLVHCVGENWQWDALNYRSCSFQSLCFDTVEEEFVIAPTVDHRPGLLRPHDSVATDHHKKFVTMGESIRIGNGKPWFPNASTHPTSSYYKLEEDIVWLLFVPEHAYSNNPGHLLWDYWMPLYNLLKMFGHEKSRLLLTHMDPPCLQGDKSRGCLGLIMKYLSLLGLESLSFTSTRTSDIAVSLPNNESRLVCAHTALAGIGMLTDHGFKKHGQLFEDYQTVRNVARGAFFWDFRNFMLRQMGKLSGDPTSVPDKITFLVNSSNNPARRSDFSQQVSMTRRRFPDRIVQTIELGHLSLEEQLVVMRESSICISVIGGSASTAMFMERNTCLILFYNSDNDFVKGAPTDQMPNFMDWDFWNNASYLRLNWLPLKTMDAEEDLELLMDLIASELALTHDFGGAV